MRTFKKCPDCTRSGACSFAAVYSRLIESGAFYEDVLRKACPHAKPTAFELELIQEMQANIKALRLKSKGKEFANTFAQKLPKTITTHFNVFCKN